MKISDLIRDLQKFENDHGNITVSLQDESVAGHELFFVVAEEYQDEAGRTETRVNLRTWPY